MGLILLILVVLFLVGVYKAKMTVGNMGKTGIQMVIIGMSAAIAGYLIGNFFTAK